MAPPIFEAVADRVLPPADDTLGFDHLGHVRIRVTARGLSAEVTGVLHRRPRTLPVPIALAARLVAQGVPVTVRHENGSA